MAFKVVCQRGSFGLMTLTRGKEKRGGIDRFSRPRYCTKAFNLGVPEVVGTCSYKFGRETPVPAHAVGPERNGCPAIFMARSTASQHMAREWKNCRTPAADLPNPVVGLAPIPRTRPFHEGGKIHPEVVGDRFIRVCQRYRRRPSSRRKRPTEAGWRRRCRCASGGRLHITFEVAPTVFRAVRGCHRGDT